MARTGKEGKVEAKAGNGPKAEAKAGNGPKAEAKAGNQASASTPEVTISATNNELLVEPPAQGGNTTAMEARDVEFTSQSTFAAVPGVKSIEVDADTVLVDVLKDKYVRLNSTGTFIWRLLIEGRPFGEISGQVAQHFDIDSNRASEETSAFLKGLINSGMAVQQGEQRFSERRTET
jgi:hypothetical protein